MFSFTLRSSVLLLLPPSLPRFSSSRMEGELVEVRQDRDSQLRQLRNKTEQSVQSLQHQHSIQEARVGVGEGGEGGRGGGREGGRGGGREGGEVGGREGRWEGD